MVKNCGTSARVLGPEVLAIVVRNDPFKTLDQHGCDHGFAHALHACHALIDKTENFSSA
jgi:hypothetical protein